MLIPESEIDAILHSNILRPFRFALLMAHPTQHIRFCTSRDGVRLAFTTCSSGPPLVRMPNQFSHLKFDWDSPIWGHWLSLFVRRHMLARYDMRGCGLSDRDGVEFSFEKYIDDLHAVVE